MGGIFITATDGSGEGDIFDILDIFDIFDLSPLTTDLLLTRLDGSTTATLFIGLGG